MRTDRRQQRRVEQAILYFVRHFPGRMGPNTIQAGVAAVFYIPEEECSPIEDRLAFLESAGLIIRRDSDLGYPVFFPTNRIAALPASNRAGVQFKTTVLEPPEPPQ
jgi:hypothetical protein